MKYLSDYLNEPLTKLHESNGAFWAFGNKQFEEQKKDGVEYVSLGGGLCCPKENAKAVVEGLDRVVEEAIEQDLADHTPKQIIKRELGNHECYYTGDPTPAIEALDVYGFSEKKIWHIFKGVYHLHH